MKVWSFEDAFSKMYSFDHGYCHDGVFKIYGLWYLYIFSHLNVDSNFEIRVWEHDVGMSSFSITRKKTPFQKHREEEEAKKKVGLFLIGKRVSNYIDLVLKINNNFLFLYFREPRMKLHVCMRSLWSLFKEIVHLVQKLLFEEE